MEPLLKKIKMETEPLFTGEKLCCESQLLQLKNWCGFLYSGCWRDNGQEKKTLIRRIQKNDCRENWKNMICIKHENVLNVIEYEEDLFDWRYFALERFDATLEQYCKGEYTGPMPFKTNVLCQISKGLNYIHKRGLTHGLLNPRSILIIHSESVLIKISDFTYGNLKVSQHFDGLLHPKYWKLPDKIMSAFTVYSDVFAAGCVFFYYLTRGFHPFGNANASILANIENNQPVNLEKLDKNHFAYQSIKDMVGEPSKNGTQYLRIAAAHFKDVSPYEFKEILKTLPEINEKVLVYFHPTLPLLACYKCKRITLFSASKCSVPFSHWKEDEVKFEGKNLEEITVLQWNLKGDFVAAGCEDGCVIVWQYPTGQIVFKVTLHFEDVIAIYWNASTHSELFATNDSDGKQLIVWNSNLGERIKNLVCTINSVRMIVHVVWASNHQIITGCDDGTINMFQIKESEPLLLKTFEDKGTIFRLFWDESSHYLASVTSENLNIWSVDNNEAIHSSNIESSWCCLKLFPNRKSSEGIDAARKSMKNLNFAFGLSNGSIVIWNPFERDKSPLYLEKHTNLVINVSFSHDGKFLASSSMNEIIIWSTESWTVVFKGISEHSKEFSWLTEISHMEPTYKLAVSSKSGMIRIIEIADEEYHIYNDK